MLIKGEGLGRLITGRLIRDAENKKVGSKSTSLTKFAVAFGDGEKDVLNVIVWFDAADMCAGLKKRDRVLVGGQLKSHEYEGKTYWELEADYIQPMGKNAEVRHEQGSIDTSGFTDVTNEDIPF